MLPTEIHQSNDIKLAAGFVLNKLYTKRYFGRRNNKRHGRHTELANMQKGYPPDKGGFIKTACDQMRGKMVLIFPSTGEYHICALLEDDAIRRGLEICNYYRREYELPPLDMDLGEIQEKRTEVSEKKTYRKLREKRKKILGENQEMGGRPEFIRLVCTRELIFRSPID